MGDEPTPRAALLRALTDRVQEVSWASDRLGHVFASNHSLHPTDFRALSSIYRAERLGQPFTAKALARDLELSPAAVTYVVGRLVAAGHVRRDHDPSDGRRVILRYAEPGSRLAARFFGPLGAAHADALASFEDEELAAAARVLGCVVETIDGFQDEVRARGREGLTTGHGGTPER